MSGVAGPPMIGPSPSPSPSGQGAWVGGKPQALRSAPPFAVLLAALATPGEGAERRAGPGPSARRREPRVAQAGGRGPRWTPRAAAPTLDRVDAGWRGAGTALPLASAPDSTAGAAPPRPTPVPMPRGGDVSLAVAAPRRSVVVPRMSGAAGGTWEAGSWPVPHQAPGAAAPLAARGVRAPLPGGRRRTSAPPAAGPPTTGPVTGSGAAPAGPWAAAAAATPSRTLAAGLAGAGGGAAGTARAPRAVGLEWIAVPEPSPSVSRRPARSPAGVSMDQPDRTGPLGRLGSDPGLRSGHGEGPGLAEGVAAVSVATRLVAVGGVGGGAAGADTVPGEAGVRIAGSGEPAGAPRLLTGVHAALAAGPAGSAAGPVAGGRSHTAAGGASLPSPESPVGPEGAGAMGRTPRALAGARRVTTQHGVAPGTTATALGAGLPATGIPGPSWTGVVDGSGPPYAVSSGGGRGGEDSGGSAWSQRGDWRQVAPQRFQVRLEPPGLGPVNIRVQLRGGAVHAALAVDDAVAGGLLLAASPSLQVGLARHGLQLGTLSVGTGPGAAPGESGGQGGRQPSQPPPAPSPAAARRAASGERPSRAGAAAPTMARVVGYGARVDVVG